MSTRTALTVVGAVVGAYFGYPQLGFVVGSMVGAAVDPQQIQGPRIGEVQAQTSADGVPRPIIYGTYPTFGNIIQTGQVVKVEETESQGKGGPEVTTERALRTFAIRVCEGPIAAYLRIWEDNKLVYDVRQGSGMLAESAKWAANKVFYYGDETQLPDPTLVATVNADTPAYRGTAYFVAVLEDVTDRQGSISQYRFEVANSLAPPVVESITSSATIPVYATMGVPEFAFVFLNYLAPPDSDYGVNAAVGTSLVNAIPMDESQPYKVLEIDETCATVGTANIYIDSASFGSASPVPSPTLSPLGSYGPYSLYMGTTYPSKAILYLTTGGGLVSVPVPNGASAINWAKDNTSENKFIGRYLWMTESHVYLGVRQLDGINHNAIYCWPTTTGSAPDYRVNAIASISSVCSAAAAHFFTHFGRDGKYRTINDVGAYKVYSATLVLESSETLPFSIAGLSSFGIDGDLMVYTLETTSHLIVRKVSDWSIQSTYTNSVIGDKDLNCRVIFTDESVFIQCQDTILRSEYSTGLVGEPAILSDIVSDIHDRCGSVASTFDVSELDDEVAGFGLAGDYTGASGIDALRPIYNFDKSLHDGKFYYPKRGAAVIETLTVDDLTEIPDTTKREQALDVPKKFHLRYQHAASGYAPVKASVPRTPSPDFLTTGEASMEIPVVINEDQAMQCADKIYKVMRAEQAGTTEITVPLDVGAKYAEANCIGLSLRGRTARYRIEQADFADWKIKLTLKPDRQSAYTSDLTGVPIPEPTLPPSTIVGATELAVMDIASRVDSEDELGIVIAVDGALPPWYGARYQRSLDGGSSYTTVEDMATASIMGVLLDDVAAASEHYTDTTNVVRVQLYRSTHSLESISDIEFLSEGGGFALENADGSWEVLQGRDWVDEGSQVFAGTVLHRGRLNSGATAHAAGMRFVKLDRPTFFSAQSAWIGQDLTHRAISLGESADDTTNDVTVEYVGRSQIEWPVTDLALARDVSDVITWSFSARHRFGSEDAPVASINFQGFRITLDDGVDSVTFDTTSQSGTYDASALGASLTFSVSAINRITGAGPETSETV